RGTTGPAAGQQPARPGPASAARISSNRSRPNSSSAAPVPQKPPCKQRAISHSRERAMRTTAGILIRARLCSPPGQAGQGRSLRSRRRGDGASATLDSPALPGVFRQLSDEAPLRLGRVAGRCPAMLGQHPPSTTPLQLASQVASTSPACQLPKPDAVKGGLTPKRPRRQVENDEYSAFVRRILAPTPAASATATLRPWPSCSAWPRRSTPP